MQGWHREQRRIGASLPDDLKERLRQSYVCDCGPERRSRVRTRITLRNLEDDVAERILRDAKEATGARPTSCPWYALRDPFVIAVVNNYGLFKARQLAAKYGGDDYVPAALIEGLAVFDSALNGVQNHDLRKEREAREDDRRRAAEQADGPGPTLNLPRGRRRRSR